MTSKSLKVESGLQLLVRLNKKSNVINFYQILFKEGLKPGDSVEIYGGPNTGKTILSIDFICAALMPRKLGGFETGVLVFNTDGNMSMDSLIEILKQKILSTSKLEHVEQEAEILFHESLMRLHTIDIYDVTQFYITIQNLEAILLEHPNISLVMFDTLTAYYWSEETYNKMDLHLKFVLKLVQRATKEYKCIIIYTRPEYFNSNKSAFEHLEVCSKNPTLECVNYRINLIAKIANSEGNTVYQATIRNFDSKFEKTFNIVNNTLSWCC